MATLPLTFRAVSDGGADDAFADWCPPPHLSGCTQAVVRRGAPILVRNYDYEARSFDATILLTDYAGRRVLGIGDCVWGLLDGLNDDGLAATLTFGGSREVGVGFGISIVMRYLLETCTTVVEALAVLDRVPVHMAYNATVLDAAGAAATAFIGPGRPSLHVDPPVVTNHQEHRATEQFAKLSHSRDREVAVRAVPAADGDEERAIQAFLDAPTYNRHFDHSFGARGASRSPPSSRASDRWSCTPKRYQANRDGRVALRARPATDPHEARASPAFRAKTFWGRSHVCQAIRW